MHYSNGYETFSFWGERWRGCVIDRFHKIYSLAQSETSECHLNKIKIKYLLQIWDCCPRLWTIYMICEFSIRMFTKIPYCTHVTYVWCWLRDNVMLQCCEGPVSQPFALISVRRRSRTVNQRVRGKWCLSCLVLNLACSRYRSSGYNNTNIVLSGRPYALIPFKALPYSDVMTVLSPQCPPRPFMHTNEGVNKWLHADVM